ncbi:hypothetical protein D3C72_2554780 [compost metagenome]
MPQLPPKYSQPPALAMALDSSTSGRPRRPASSSMIRPMPDGSHTTVSEDGGFAASHMPSQARLT